MKYPSNPQKFTSITQTLPEPRKLQSNIIDIGMQGKVVCITLLLVLCVAHYAYAHTGHAHASEKLAPTLETEEQIALLHHGMTALYCF
jgi:hypothetical protein